MLLVFCYIIVVDYVYNDNYYTILNQSNFIFGGVSVNNTLTNRQIAFILFGVIVGYGIMGLPTNMAANTGTASWITLLISTVMAVTLTYIITYLGHVYDNKTIYEYSKLLVGKVLSVPAIMIYIIYFFLFFTMEVRLVSEIIRSIILLRTPIWILTLVQLLVVFYSLSKGLLVIARICELYGVIILIFYIFIHTLLFTQGKLINLRPFLGTGDVLLYMKSSLKALIPFLGFEILTVIPISSKKNTKKVYKYTTIMIAIIGLLYVYIVESCISVTGVDSIVYYRNAVLATIRRSDFPWLQFLRRLDGIVIVAWIMSTYCTLTIFSYGAISLTSKFAKKVRFNYIALIILALSFVVSSIPKNIESANKLLDYTGYLGIIPAAVIPVILLIITKVKKYDKKSH